MPLKRKAEEDYSLPPKRAFVQQNGEHAGTAALDGFPAGRFQSMDADVAPAAAEGLQQDHDQSEQQKVPVPLSTCTDLVVYKPPPALESVMHTAVISLPPVLLNNGRTVDLQQPNAMATVLRSLTPQQRASLKGMWDVLRDQKLLQNMLRKLPSTELQDDVNGTAAGDQGPKVTHCIVEEPDSDQDDTVVAAASRSVPTATNGPTWLQPTVEVAETAAAGAAVSPGGFAAPGSTASPAIQAAAGTAVPFNTAQHSGQQVWLSQQQQMQQQGQQQQQWHWQQQRGQQPYGSEAMMVDSAGVGPQQQSQPQQQQPGTVVDDSAPMDMDM